MYFQYMEDDIGILRHLQIIQNKFEIISIQLEVEISKLIMYSSLAYR